MVQPAPSASAEAPDEQELRLALVMTGGVSLAIWIGGAAYEIYRAERARDDRPDREHSYVYQKLLELTQCTIQVDVVSGASAGGINGALYSFAKSRNVAIDDFGQLRDLWRDDASMEKLLRRPTERNPPSLLDGDKYFKPRLVRALQNLNAAGVGSAHDAPTLHIAVTLLNPQSRRFTDDLGSPFAEVDHAGLFKFPASAFDGDAIVEQLALAARSSSSFPGAFEASFVPVGPADATSIDGRPNMAALATFDTSRFTVDGGVLLNEPIAPALEAIAEQPSSKEVRRVLAFVDPSPAAAETDIADDAKSAPTLGTVLWKSLLTIPRVQSVTAQIDTIRNNNRRVLAQGATRRVVASGDPSVVARALWPLYRSRRIDGSVRAIQDVLRHQALLKPHYEDDDPTWRALTASIERWRSEWLPQEFPEHPEQWTSPGWAAAAAQDGANPWPWGIDPLSYAVSAGLDVVRSAFSLAPRGSDDPVASTYRMQLGASREALHDLRRDLRVLTELNDQFWRKRAVVVCASFKSAVLNDEAAIIDLWAKESFASWPGAPDVYTDSEDAANGWSAFVTLLSRYEIPTPATPAPWFLPAYQLQRRIADAIVDKLVGLGVSIGQFARSWRPGGEPLPPEHEIYEVAQLAKALTGNLVLDDELDERRRQLALQALLSFYAVQVTTGNDPSVVEQPVELVLVSADAPCALDATRDTHKKLAGLQLDHFGAFLKESWRANDWMWGRLDAAAVIVRMLLSPRRLFQLKVSAAEVSTALHDMLVHGTAGDDTDYVEREWDAHALSLQLELAPLDDSDPARVPTQLPIATSIATLAIQLHIARKELLNVNEAMAQSKDDGAGTPHAARAFSTYIARLQKDDDGLHIADVVGAFTKCEVGSELIGGEIGQDQTTRVAAQATLVATNAISGARAGLGPLKGAVAVARGGIVVAYLVVQAAMTRTRTGFAALVLALAAAGSVLGVRLAGVSTPAWLLFVAVATLGTWALVEALTAGFWRAGLSLAVVGLLLAWSLVPPDEAKADFTGSTTAIQQAGWKHWMLDHLQPAAAIVAALALCALFVVLLRRRHALVAVLLPLAVVGLGLALWSSAAANLFYGADAGVKGALLAANRAFYDYRIPIAGVILGAWSVGSVVFRGD